MKKVNKRKGFTLAELLVVIAILAILVAVAVPIFSGTLDEAKSTVKAANFRAAESAAMVDYLTNGGTGTQKYSYTVSQTDEKLTIEKVSEGDVGAVDEYSGIVEVGS